MIRWLLICWKPSIRSVRIDAIYFSVILTHFYMFLFQEMVIPVVVTVTGVM